MQTENEQNIYQMFRVSVLLKGAISFAEMLAGIILLFVPLDEILNFALYLLSFLLGNWGSYISSTLIHFTVLFRVSDAFIAFYLFSRGLIKFLLIIALLKNKLWAYPWSLVVLGLFVIYQIYHMLVSYSSIVLCITLFDLVVMYFIWREYLIVKKHLSEKLPV